MTLPDGTRCGWLRPGARPSLPRAPPQYGKSRSRRERGPRLCVAWRRRPRRRGSPSDTWPHSPPTTFNGGPARTLIAAPVARRTGPPRGIAKRRCGTWSSSTLPSSARRPFAPPRDLGHAKQAVLRSLLPGQQVLHSRDIGYVPKLGGGLTDPERNSYLIGRGASTEQGS
jgi:hypothetical protein